jgi:Carboxypeptidase regulatory-like domain
MVAQVNDTNSRRRRAVSKKDIATVLISAVVTVTLGLFKVLPQLWDRDSQIKGLEVQVEKLTRQASAATDSKEKEPATPKRQFTGTVLDSSGKPLGHAEVYLIPTGSQLTVTTGDDGKFAFKDIPDQPYKIVVREPKNGAAFGLIQEGDKNPDTLGWATVEYHFR